MSLNKPTNQKEEEEEVDEEEVRGNVRVDPGLYELLLVRPPPLNKRRAFPNASKVSQSLHTRPSLFPLTHFAKGV